MEPNEPNGEKQLRKPNAFTLINNVRDHCNQSDAKVRLMFVLATHCDKRTGICFPSNELLARKMRKGVRMIQKMLAELKADGEITILATGAGRNKKREISLTRYLHERNAVTVPHMSTSVPHMSTSVTVNMNSASSCLDMNTPPSKMSLNNHSEQPSLSTREHAICILRAANGATSVSRYSFEEQEKLDVFRSKLSQPDPHWLPINKYSECVSEALECWDLKEIKQLCTAAAWMVANGHDAATFTDPETGEQFDYYLPTPNQRTGKRTLVRLLRVNYEQQAI